MIVATSSTTPHQPAGTKHHAKHASGQKRHHRQGEGIRERDRAPAPKRDDHQNCRHRRSAPRVRRALGRPRPGAPPWRGRRATDAQHPTPTPSAQLVHHRLPRHGRSWRVDLIVAADGPTPTHSTMSASGSRSGPGHPRWRVRRRRHRPLILPSSPARRPDIAGGRAAAAGPGRPMVAPVRGCGGCGTGPQRAGLKEGGSSWPRPRVVRRRPSARSAVGAIASACSGRRASC